jgi:hypothetical protein
MSNGTNQRPPLPDPAPLRCLRILLDACDDTHEARTKVPRDYNELFMYAVCEGVAVYAVKQKIM